MTIPYLIAIEKKVGKCFIVLFLTKLIIELNSKCTYKVAKMMQQFLHFCKNFTQTSELMAAAVKSLKISGKWRKGVNHLHFVLENTTVIILLYLYRNKI